MPKLIVVFIGRYARYCFEGYKMIHVHTSFQKAVNQSYRSRRVL